MGVGHIAIIGGCGHVGLPLGVSFAKAGFKTTLIDINQDAVNMVNSGKFPFLESGGDEALASALANGLIATTDASKVQKASVVVFVIGTPVDEHLNPKLSDVLKTFEAYKALLEPGTLIVMRSTLYPGTMEHLYNKIQSEGMDVRMAFCPERVAEGYALEEITNLPQIVSAFDEESFEAAYNVFSAIAPTVIRLTPLEAELTKLMANSWRYLEFAIANQFYMIAESSGVDFYKIFQAIKYDYPRAQGYKAPGFAAGPCLFKDTMQLASFYDNQFYFGHSAMLVNEGLAGFAVDKLVAQIGGANKELWGKKVALLGLAFKAENDDIRESLSFKIKKCLEFKGADVIVHDPYLASEVPLEEVLDLADGVIIATPHKIYRELHLHIPSKASGQVPCVDVWGIYNKVGLEVLPGIREEQGLAAVASAGHLSLAEKKASNA